MIFNKHSGWCYDKARDWVGVMRMLTPLCGWSIFSCLRGRWTLLVVLVIYEALNALDPPPPCLVDLANIDSGHQGLKHRKNETSFAVVVLDYSL